jgi:cytochrome P450
VLDLRRPRTRTSPSAPGPHGCLGQHIARIEIDAMLREVLTRMTDFELAAPVEWLPRTSSPAEGDARALPRRLKREGPRLQTGPE